MTIEELVLTCIVSLIVSLIAIALNIWWHRELQEKEEALGRRVMNWASTYHEQSERLQYWQEQLENRERVCALTEARLLSEVKG